jgi:cytochrome c-type biogenesis protein CcmH/NrfG
VDSTNKDIFFNFGLAYFNLEKYDNALKEFKRVVAKDPTDCDGWAFVGHSTLNLNDEKGALESYEKATAPTCNLTPAYAPPVWQNLCRLYTRKNMMDKAKAACKKAEELAPKK